MLINLSNHPSTRWPAEQLCVARQRYGEVRDMAFPAVPPAATSEEVRRMAHDTVAQLPAEGGFTLHVMGEMTLTYAIVALCKEQGIECVASTTERITCENEDGTKTSTFRFTRFREY